MWSPTLRSGMLPKCRAGWQSMPILYLRVRRFHRPSIWRPNLHGGAPIRGPRLVPTYRVGTSRTAEVTLSGFRRVCASNPLWVVPSATHLHGRLTQQSATEVAPVAAILSRPRLLRRLLLCELRCVGLQQMPVFYAKSINSLRRSAKASFAPGVVMWPQCEFPNPGSRAADRL